MRKNTFAANQPFPITVTVWDKEHPFYGNPCKWIGRDGDLLEVEYDGKLKLVGYKSVCIGDNSHASLDDQ